MSARSITGCKPVHVLLFILSLTLVIHPILIVKGLLPASRYSRYGVGQQHPWNQKVHLMETRSYSHMVRGVTTRTWSSEGQTLNSAPRGWRRLPRRNGTCTVLLGTSFLKLPGNHHCPSTLNVDAWGWMSSWSKGQVHTCLQHLKLRKKIKTIWCLCCEHLMAQLCRIMMVPASALPHS